jgi:hypothetical protein
MVTTPIDLLTGEEGPGVDAPPGIGGAFPIPLTTGDSSGMELGFVSGNADGPPGSPDVDTWKISIPGPGSITAEIFSAGLFGPAGYNTMLELLPPGGGPPIFAVDNVHYLDDKYNDPTDPLRQLDPFILNFTVPIGGDFYLRVVPMVPPPPGGTYWLLAGFQPIPEPGSAITLLGAVAGIALRRARRR